jgi:hypothetical protein
MDLLYTWSFSRLSAREAWRRKHFRVLRDRYCMYVAVGRMCDACTVLDEVATRICQGGDLQRIPAPHMSTSNGGAGIDRICSVPSSTQIQRPKVKLSEGTSSKMDSGMR